MSKILLSITIPTYNRPERISDIINQIIPFQSNEIEIIIGDDNPNHNRTENVLREIKDPRIKYFRNEKNLGFDANVLKTIEKASGEFIYLLMDDDDVEIESFPWILKKIKKNKNLSQICGIIGDKRPGRKIYFTYEDKILKRGSDSILELLFHYPHGSGIILRKNAINLNKARKYIGYLYIQHILIAQALIAGDTLCTSKIIAHIGKEKYKSDQPLISGRTYSHPIRRLQQMRFQMMLIYEITENNKEIRSILLKRKFSGIYWILKSSLKESFKTFFEALQILSRMNYISKNPMFWPKLIIYIFQVNLKSFLLKLYFFLFRR